MASLITRQIFPLCHFTNTATKYQIIFSILHNCLFHNVLHCFTFQFCFKSCKFKVQKSKEGTGRVVIWNMGVQNSYTMEVRRQMLHCGLHRCAFRQTGIKGHWLPGIKKWFLQYVWKGVQAYNPLSNKQ